MACEKITRYLANSCLLLEPQANEWLLRFLAHRSRSCPQTREFSNRLVRDLAIAVRPIAICRFPLSLSRPVPVRAFAPRADTRLFCLVTRHPLVPTPLAAVSPDFQPNFRHTDHFTSDVYPLQVYSSRRKKIPAQPAGSVQQAGTDHFIRTTLITSPHHGQYTSRVFHHPFFGLLLADFWSRASANSRSCRASPASSLGFHFSL